MEETRVFAALFTGVYEGVEEILSVRLCGSEPAAGSLSS